MRPSHVEPVTQGENNRRGFGYSGQNVRKTHCPRGHEYTPENTRVYKTSRFCQTCQRAAKDAYNKGYRARSL